MTNQEYKNKLALLELKEELIKIQKKQLYDQYINNMIEDKPFINSELRSIRANWRSHPLHQNGMWEGNIIIDKNGWFEGIVTNNAIKDYKNSHKIFSKHKEYYGDSFVFGIHIEKKLLELIKLSPEYVSDPIVFRNIFNNNKVKIHNSDFGSSKHLIFNNGLFSGYFYVPSCSNREGHIIYGEQVVSVDNSNLTCIDKQELMKKIEMFKTENIFKELYDKAFTKRKELSKKLLELYNEGVLQKLQLLQVTAYIDSKMTGIEPLLPSELQGLTFSGQKDEIPKHAIEEIYDNGYTYKKTLCKK